MRHDGPVSLGIDAAFPAIANLLSDGHLQRHWKRQRRQAECLSALVFVGRRDWTRTNDPHHVKVVL
jgi:hypothetical protein